MRARSVGALVFLLGCASESPTRPTSPSPETSSEAGATSEVVIAIAEAPRTALGIAPPGTVDERIAALEKAMRDTRFADAGIMVELARLQLARDNGTADSDGPSDAARGKKNAMRAVAVDEKSAAARLVLALGIAQSFRPLGADDMRAARLKLVDICASSIPPSDDSIAAASRALNGYLLLEYGDRALAKAAFEAATKLDPKLAAAWAGLGDALRAGKDFSGALDAYKQAAGYLPDDAGIEAAMAAAEKGIVLTLPTPPASPLVDSGEPLGGKLDVTASCDATTRQGSGNGELCAGLDALAQASGSRQLDDAATRVLNGFQDLKPLCEQRDPACGEHVATALYLAANAYRRAGMLAKSVATSKLLMGNPSLPGARGLVAATTLEVADQYFAIGVFDSAADNYERYLVARGPRVTKARARAELIRRAFRDVGDATRPQAGPCPSPLPCGVRYLVSDSRWAKP